MSIQAMPYPDARYIDSNLIEESNGRILIVDDEDSVRETFAECLSERYSCERAATAKEALEHLSRKDFALVISDIIMPGLSGVELLREVTARFPDTDVIIVSGVGRTQRVLDAVRIGAFDYLLKPCDLDILERSVERAMERRALLRAAQRYRETLEARNTELARRKSEMEELQTQIVHTEKMASLGRLAAGVAHELNNPAGFIYGNMQILGECAAGIEQLLRLYDTMSLPATIAAEAAAVKEKICYENSLADMREIIADCHAGAERIRDVVQNLRLFSRLDEAEFKKIDLHESIESTIRLLLHYYNAQRITLRRDYTELPPVDCYAGQLNQVWMNLLLNAAQELRTSGGEVSIKTCMANEAVQISISDTGRGITPEHLTKIYEPFFTTKPVGEGTGLGLSITLSIIERHGGSIRVDSVVGQGTTFTVQIPINAARRAGADGL